MSRSIAELGYSTTNGCEIAELEVLIFRKS